MKLNIPKNKIDSFCMKWKITELSFFGSVLRDDFTDKSDIDVLVDFSSDSAWSLWDHAQMEVELSQILNRKVEIITKSSVVHSENWVIKEEILNSAEIFHES